MTHNTAPGDDLTALLTFLRAYTPTGLAEETWANLRDDAVDLALAAGPPEAERARKDLQLLADVARYLTHTRIPITLDAVLADATLAGFDAHLVAAGRTVRTRENKRGRFRRLQATHRQVPWRRKRRADGERILAMASPDWAHRIEGLLPEDRTSGTRGAGAVQAALEDARRRRRAEPGPPLTPEVWTAARRYADAMGTPITKRLLDAVATFEVLAEPCPVADAVAQYELTRRDLDLGLVLATGLPPRPNSQHQALLRG